MKILFMLKLGYEIDQRVLEIQIFLQKIKNRWKPMNITNGFQIFQKHLNLFFMGFC